MAGKPEVGDLILHEEPFFERKTIGTVMLMMTSSFAYSPEDSESDVWRICQLKEEWKLLDKTE